MPATYYLSRSWKSDKKWVIRTPTGKHVHFGARGYSDYTKHKTASRKRRYMSRHKSRENWSNKSTAGFWARWLLWSEPSIAKAIAMIQRRFKIKIVRGRGPAASGSKRRSRRRSSSYRRRKRSYRRRRRSYRRRKR